ncbi:acyl-CoA carboxylase subunit epsilon [Kitasatospora sp. GAS1066B]|uniref:acyl-CoA carboxylase subunit epsilon n=1 Tax=Kitasatospora sp. GAS1066B TaxID=3156271 RepID=UPI00351553ED
MTTVQDTGRPKDTGRRTDEPGSPPTGAEVLRVLRGNPTAEEVAATTAVLLGLLRHRAPADPPADVRGPIGWDRPEHSTHRVARSWRR